MKDTFEFTLNSPLTEEQWDMISDVDFDRTDNITFHTKHGKEVEFTKVIRCKDCKKNGTSDCSMGRWIYSDNIVFLKEHWNKPQDYCSWAEPKDNGQIRCKDCIHNVANRETDPLDTTDYSGIDIVCDYFMTDGQEPDDYCSHAERKKDGK